MFIWVPPYISGDSYNALPEPQFLIPEESDSKIIKFKLECKGGAVELRPSKLLTALQRQVNSGNFFLSGISRSQIST